MGIWVYVTTRAVVGLGFDFFFVFFVFFLTRAQMK